MDKPRILHEDPSYLIVEKPSGMLVHPVEHVVHPVDPPTSQEEAAGGLSLAELLAAQYPEIAGVGDEPNQRPGIVHRIDRDVSGVLVVARSQASYEHLKRQFQDHAVEKHYLALVHGIVQRDDGEITTPLARSHRPGKAAAPRTDGIGRTAFTRFTVVQRLQHYTLLDVEILTGRTHQIRAHLASIGHAIVGDAQYRPKKMHDNFPRPFLHAASLAFTDADGNRVQYMCPLPTDLATFLTRQGVDAQESLGYTARAIQTP